MGYIDTVKGWFVSKAKPSQSQYHTLFDYLRFKDQPISMNEVQSLLTILQSKLDVSVYEATSVSLSIQEVSFDGDGVIVIAPGYLFEKCIVLPSIDTVLKIGLTVGGEEIFPELGVSSLGEVVIIEKYSAFASRTFYFSGLPVGSSIITLIRKIKDVE